MSADDVTIREAVAEDVPAVAALLADDPIVGTLQLTTDRRRTEAHRFYERLGMTPSHLGFTLDLT